MTGNASSRFLIGLLLLSGSAIIVVEGVYQVFENHGVAWQPTFAFFAIACFAAIAPSFYGFFWLRGWRAWLVTLLSLPLLALVAGTLWKLVTHSAS